jgi:hypothetical protein
LPGKCKALSSVPSTEKKKKKEKIEKKKAKQKNAQQTSNRSILPQH